MIRYFLSGVIAGAVVKMALVFLFFHFMYLVILKDDNVASFLIYFKFIADIDTLNKIYMWILKFKPVFLTSAWFVVATTFVFIGIPITSIVITAIKNSKKKGGGF